MVGHNKLSRNTKIFSLVSFLVDVSSEMVIPLLPFFLTHILLAPVIVLGIIEAAREFTANIFGTFAGVYSDRVGKRKKLVILGYTLSGLMKGFLVIATSWVHVLAIVFFERLGKGLREAPRDALMAMSENKQNVGRAFGFRKLADNLGAVIGPMIAGVLLVMLIQNGEAEAYRTVFLIAIIPAVIAVLLTFFVHEKKIDGDGVGAKAIVAELLAVKNYKQFIVIAFIFGLGQFANTFLLLRAGEHLGLIFIPLVYLAYNVFYTIFALPAGQLADRIGARKVLIIGYALFLLALIGFAYFDDLATVFVFFALVGIFMAINETAPRILIARRFGNHHLASALGFYQGVSGAAALPANVLAGGLWSMEILSTHAAFVFSIITTAIAIGMLYFYREE